MSNRGEVDRDTGSRIVGSKTTYEIVNKIIKRKAVPLQPTESLNCPGTRPKMLVVCCPWNGYVSNGPSCAPLYNRRASSHGGRCGYGLGRQVFNYSRQVCGNDIFPFNLLAGSGNKDHFIRPDKGRGLFESIQVIPPRHTGEFYFKGPDFSADSQYEIELIPVRCSKKKGFTIKIIYPGTGQYLSNYKAFPTETDPRLVY